jgi:rhodanese-related sulfurtransferase
MIAKLNYTIAATVLIAGFALPGVLMAGCGSCGPAAAPKVAAPAACKSGCPVSKAATCKAACPHSKAKACGVRCAKPCCKKSKACPAGCTKPCCQKAETAEIQTHALQALLNAGISVTVLDARSGKWDDGRRIPGAKSLAPGSNAKAAAAVIPSKSSLVVTYCSGVKCPASRMLAATLKSLGYENVLEYPVGIAGWAKHGNLIEKAK